MNTKRYEHDCDACIFLDRWKEYDLYICIADDKLLNFVARHSSNGPDYTSGLNVAIEQYNAVLNGGMLLPLGMAITKAKQLPVVQRYVKDI